MSRCGGPTAEHRGAVTEVRSLSWQVARGHLQQDVDVTGVCGLSPAGQLHLGTGLLGLRILGPAFCSGKQSAMGWGHRRGVRAGRAHWFVPGGGTGCGWGFWGAPTLLLVVTAWFPPGEGAVCSAHAALGPPLLLVAACAPASSCAPLLPTCASRSAWCARGVLVAVCVTPAAGWGVLRGVAWAKEQSLRACAVCVCGVCKC